MRCLNSTFDPFGPLSESLTMKNIKIVSLFLISFLWPAISWADYYTGFLWYRVEPDFSRIVITKETIRGHRGVDGFKAKAKEHEKAGKYHTHAYGQPVKKVIKVEEMDGHVIRTELVIRPPRGRGLGGAVPRCSIRVFFDGELKLDCPIGYSFLHSLNVSKVIIHAQEQMAEVVYNESPATLPVFNFFEHGKETIVLEEGKLVSKPSKPKPKPRE